MNYTNTFYNAYSDYKVPSIRGRYIHLEHIEPLLESYKHLSQIRILGASVENRPIYSITLDSGHQRIHMWSQMHGNEYTNTKAVLDVLKIIKDKEEFRNYVVNKFTLCI